jgi:hypothetical protein
LLGDTSVADGVAANAGGVIPAATLGNGLLPVAALGQGCPVGSESTDGASTLRAPVDSNEASGETGIPAKSKGSSIGCLLTT